MYAIPNASRVYISLFLCLCAAVLLAPSVASANVPDTLRPDLQDLIREVRSELNDNVKRPSNSTLVPSQTAPTISKNAAGGLSASTNQILKTMDQPSSFSATSNRSLSTTQSALKACVRSSACIGRALGAGAVVYEGIHAWKEVIDMVFDDQGQIARKIPKVVPPSGGGTCQSAGNVMYDSCQQAFNEYRTVQCPPSNPNPPWFCPMYLEQYSSNRWDARASSNGNILANFYIIDNCPPNSSVSVNGCLSAIEYNTEPLGLAELDQLIDQNYEPDISDAPIIFANSSPDNISLTTPTSSNLPATTSTNTDSQGQTTTTVKNSVITYSVLNNNSSSPSIESTITETSNTYDDTANLVGSMTSTTTNNAVQPDPLPPSSSSSGASVDIEIPPFCTWASIVCDWIGWTQEGIEGEEPDLINLISEFEPDESQYNSGIGSGSCPAPMSLNLGIINRTVEVSYQPFCDFLDMIRPLVIAGAWLLSAFMYVGVLRRG